MRHPKRRSTARARTALPVLGLCLLATPPPVRAESPYRLETSQEWLLAGAGAALGIGGLVLTGRAEPLTAEQINRLDVNDINSFDRATLGTLRDDHAGDILVTLSYLMPFTLLAYDETREDRETLAVMWLEASLLNLGLHQVVKAATLRTRPYVYDPDVPLGMKTVMNARLSFYSGHTSSTATNCFFMARVLTDYVDDRNAETALWTGAALYAALSGFLRQDTGHHFSTDVIVGYVIGAAIGCLVPELHRDDEDAAPGQSASAGRSLTIGLRFAF
jgi:membrane-associated phospholipid phosphatase